MIKLLKFSSLVILVLLQGCQWYYNTFYTDPDKCFEQATRDKPYEVVIVPGFPSDSAKINKTLSDRIYWANYLYINGYAKKIMFSGAAVHTPYVEARIMREYALQMNIPSEAILLETKALHSTENLYYGYRDAQDLGYTKIAFATHPAQSSFMKQFRRKFKLDLEFIPIVADSIANEDFQFQEIDASKFFVPDFTPLSEKEGLFKRLGGTRGRQVKKEIKAERKANKTD